VERYGQAKEPPKPEPEAAEPAPAPQKSEAAAGREEEVIPMSRLRRTVAERLVEAQHTAALLTTFNEIDMENVMRLRRSTARHSSKSTTLSLGSCRFS